MRLLPHEHEFKSFYGDVCVGADKDGYRFRRKLVGYKCEHCSIMAHDKEMANKLRMDSILYRGFGVFGWFVAFVSVLLAVIGLWNLS